ncbi:MULTISPECIES: L-rhamnose mutarotase [Cellulophaga]|uniref:L-fucose mutarotase n=1 Tax=Cellulophaga baltica 18 TaxID=1348584 RepID=A0AAU8RGT8_9FLAO|nr:MULTISPECIES: L-rhamnose mutarotase [Cellulophaga]AIZ41860.1 L-fucose mutarotase [Cellulophaga baltica 18]KGK30958.1 L-fucose mutarotase [Cellulophaga sp. E6(2014)]MBA6316101.1 L-rhamnose mutarotase [Cellulophaga baltica]MCR1026236.1 L-rhamnose mutarotase [Cellulophaga baltica]
MSIKRYCYSCDLKDDSKLIAEYKAYHAEGKAWPEITKSIKDAGIVDMQIYLTGNRMFMIMEVNDTFNPDKKAAMDAQNPKVQEWENLMWDYQQELPWAEKGEKWIALDKIFQL